MTGPLPVPEIDVERYGKLLLKVEAHAHRFGWDGPVHVRVVYDENAANGAADRLYRQIAPPDPQYTAVRHYGYTSTTLFSHRILYRPWDAFPPELRDPDSRASGPQPWESLRRLVVNAAYADAEEAATLRQAFRQPGLLGFVTVGEAWQNTRREPCEEAIRGEVQLADVPDSQEVRVLYSVDLAGRIQRVIRVRGRKPEVDHDADAAMRGEFTTSMRILCDIATGAVPTPEDFAARYPTLRELLDAGEWR